METLTQKTIKVGNVTVGLLGLEIALVQLSGKDISEDEAVNLLYEHVRQKNYIPKQAIEPYKEALRKEYRRYCKLDTSKDEGISIKVLGRPCVVCNKLKLTLIDILQEKNVAADIEDIQDLDEIWRYGVINTPTLIINGEVKSAGIQPPRVQLEKWIDEAVENTG
jgi:Thioredoxin domain